MTAFKKVVEKDNAIYPVRMGKKWDDDEVLQLLTSIQKKKTILEIASEHQRTIGAINSERRKLAADYWFNDKRPMEEIIKFTGLTREQIEDAIKSRTTTKVFKPKTTLTEDCGNTPSDMKEVIILLKDIQSKLSSLMEKVK